MANRIGQSFGRLTIISQSGLKSTALCECGNYITTTTYNIKSGRTSSCGCLRKEQLRERTTTHGDTGSPTYWAWAGMKTRCTNPNIHNAYAYSGKGIMYCAQWEFYERFLADMGPKPEGKTLDRIEGAKGYYKENCRWATSREQWENRNDPRIAVHHENIKRTFQELVRELECAPTIATSEPSTINSSPVP